MKKTMMQIHLDLQKSKTQVRELEDIAVQIRRDETRLEECMRKLHTAWEGESADGYRVSIQQINERLHEISGRIRMISAAAEMQAKKTWEADQEAVKQAINEV